MTTTSPPRNQQPAPAARFLALLPNPLRALLPLAAVSFLVTAPAPAAAERPNILLIMTDDQGWWDLGVNGNPHIDTPHLDRLAKDGVQFERFYVQPVCAPTRAGVMTGRYYLRTGLYNTRFGGDSMGRDEVTVAELLQRGGYRTGLFGKWHLGQYHGYQPHQRGFDEFFGHYHGHIERYELADQLVHNGTPVEARGYITDLYTGAAAEFISASTRAQKPFFCFLSHSAPHSPHQLDTTHTHQPKGDAMITKYLDRGLPLREARIYAQVERIDQNVGRLLQHLETSGLAKRTVVLFMSDNGGVSKFWNGGMRGAKASVYEGGVRSPLFVRWPGQFPAGGSVAAQTSHVDLLPTFCELAGVPLPEGRTLDGRSFAPLLRAGSGEQHHEFVYHTWNRHFPNAEQRWAISGPRYKLAGNFGDQAPPKPSGWTLFDLIDDPGETKNLAREMPDVVQKLRTEFLRWFKEVTAGQEYRPIAIPVGRVEENPVELQASWATTHSERTRYVFEAYDWDSIEGWAQPGDAAEWRIDVTTPGLYAVELAYGCAAENAGGRIRFSAAGQSVEFEPAATPTSDVFKKATAGEWTLAAGETVLRAEVTLSAGGEVLRLNRLWLRKLDGE